MLGVLGGAVSPPPTPLATPLQFVEVTADSLNIRNGVGVSPDGTRAVFAISNDAVNFYSFARLFRDGLGLPEALYFDGSISRLYDHDSGRHDAGFPMGPMLGVVVPR